MINPRWNFCLQSVLAFPKSATPTITTWILDHLSRAATHIAGGSDAKKTLGVTNLTVAIAGWASADPTSLAAAGAFASGAMVLAFDLNLLLTTVHRLHEINFQL